MVLAFSAMGMFLGTPQESQTPRMSPWMFLGTKPHCETPQEAQINSKL